jgi:hypothetical protein
MTDRPRDKRGRFLPFREGAKTSDRFKIEETAEHVKLREVEGAGARRKIQIISAGWGSSGYYSEAVLRRDGPKAWPIGTHMYVDHPTESEEYERPERSIKDLAATIVSTPQMEGTALVAEADIKEHWAPVINALANDIGVSIRAHGEHDHGEAEGREGVIITALTEGISVDFVTKAGRDGKVLELIESARAEAKQLEEARNAADWFAARIHSRFTMIADDLFGEGYLTRDERIGLSKGIGEALDAFNAFIDSDLPQLKQRDPFDEPDGDADVTERRRPGDDNQRRSPMGDDDKRLSELEESARQSQERIEALEKERDDEKTRADRAEDSLLTKEAERAVDKIIAEGQEPEGDDPMPTLPDRAWERVRKTALEGKLPLDEDGKLVTERLEERVRKAVKEEHEYLSDAKPSGEVTGMGRRVEQESSGSGNGAGNGEGELSEAEEKQLVEAFQRQGMSEDAAKIAARGR